MNDIKNVLSGTGRVNKVGFFCGKKLKKRLPQSERFDEIDFCQNHCTHKDCKGICKEFTEKFGNHRGY